MPPQTKSLTTPYNTVDPIYGWGEGRRERWDPPLPVRLFLIFCRIYNFNDKLVEFFVSPRQIFVVTTVVSKNWFCKISLGFCCRLDLFWSTSILPPPHGMASELLLPRMKKSVDITKPRHEARALTHFVKSDHWPDKSGTIEYLYNIWRWTRTQTFIKLNSIHQEFGTAMVCSIHPVASVRR